MRLKDHSCLHLIYASRQGLFKKTVQGLKGMQTSAWTTPDWCEMPPTDTNAGAVAHTCHRQHQIRPKLDPVALFLHGRTCVSECSQSSEEGGLGAIKPKRLGEDELLRMYESRHRLYNPTTQFAPLPWMCREAAQGQFAESRWTLMFRCESTWAVCCQSPQQIRIAAVSVSI